MCSCDFEVNQTKIKGSCQSGSKAVPHDSKSDFPLMHSDQKGLWNFFLVITVYNAQCSKILC